MVVGSLWWSTTRRYTHRHTKIVIDLSIQFHVHIDIYLGEVLLIYFIQRHECSVLILWAGVLVS